MHFSSSERQKKLNRNKQQETQNGRHWYCGLDCAPVIWLYGMWHVNELEKAMIMMKLHLTLPHLLLAD